MFTFLIDGVVGLLAISYQLSAISCLLIAHSPQLTARSSSAFISPQ